MKDFTAFDKLNIPVYICDSAWRIVFRNVACKKYTRSPRLNNGFDKYFVDKNGTVFPERGGELCFVSCFLGENVKTAICMEYDGFALLLFPTIIEFDILFGDISGRVRSGLSDSLRLILDEVVCSEKPNTDKYRIIEKLRKHFLSTIENYVALSMFNTEDRVIGSFEQLYGFFYKNIRETLNRSGCRVQIDVSGLDGKGSVLFTDTMYFASVISNILLFIIKIATEREVLISAELMDKYVRNEISFRCCRDDVSFGTGDGLAGLAAASPEEYLNVVLYERLCEALGWRLSYEITDGEGLNGRLILDVDYDTSVEFKSAGNRRELSPEELVRRIVKDSFLVF